MSLTAIFSHDVTHTFPYPVKRGNECNLHFLYFMPRDTKIILPIYRPVTCSDCPLLGIRPKEELQPGEKQTHICMKDGHLIAGKGLHTTDPRHRCTPRQWNKFVRQYIDGFPLSPIRAHKYQIAQQRIIYPPTELCQNQSNNPSPTSAT